LPRFTVDIRFCGYFSLFCVNLLRFMVDIRFCGYFSLFLSTCFASWLIFGVVVIFRSFCQLASLHGGYSVSWLFFAFSVNLLRFMVDIRCCGDFLLFLSTCFASWLIFGFVAIFRLSEPCGYFCCVRLGALCRLPSSAWFVASILLCRVVRLVLAFRSPFGV
jgi:hypothetical protein